MELQSIKSGSTPPQLRILALVSSICTHTHTCVRRSGFKHAHIRARAFAHARTYDDVHGVHVLLHKAKVVLVVLQRLGQELVDKVGLAHAREVARRGEQRHVHVEIVCVLDALHDLLDLVLKVDHARLAHHKVVLERDRETLAHGVAREGLLALCERARTGLIRHARGETLVKAPHCTPHQHMSEARPRHRNACNARRTVPLELAVGVLEVLVREDNRRERRVCRIRDQTVNSVSYVLVMAYQNVGKVHAAELAVAVLVGRNVVGTRPEHVGPVVDGGRCAVHCRRDSRRAFEVRARRVGNDHRGLRSLAHIGRVFIYVCTRLFNHTSPATSDARAMSAGLPRAMVFCARARVQCAIYIRLQF